MIHEHGLVSVLKDLHDRLDAAVFAAYGWDAKLDDEQLIEKLVALNAERAAEEKKGLVRWLRPEFQNAAGAAQQQTIETVEEDETPEAPVIAAGATWPKLLPERMALVRDSVAARPSVSASELVKALGAKKPPEVVEVLDGLTVIGQLVAAGAGAARRWRVAGRR